MVDIAVFISLANNFAAGMGREKESHSLIRLWSALTVDLAQIFLTSCKKRCFSREPNGTLGEHNQCSPSVPFGSQQVIFK